MYTKEQEDRALKEYERLGSVTAAIRQLGYPSESTLYRWYERRKAGLENRHGHTAGVSENTEHRCNTPEHPRYPSAEFKLLGHTNILDFQWFNLPQPNATVEGWLTV